MGRKLRRSAAIAAVLWCGGTFAVCSAFADPVKQLGATPDQDQMIQLLTPAPDDLQPGETDRGLRVLSVDQHGHKAKVPAVALDVRFATGSDALTAAARDTVDRVGKALQSPGLAGYRFLVEGHTDNTGSPKSNLALSRRRAESVKAYLVSHSGIESDRLSAEGKGSSEPLDPGNPASGVNRRVQIVNLGK